MTLPADEAVVIADCALAAGYFSAAMPLPADAVCLETPIGGAYTNAESAFLRSFPGWETDAGLGNVAFLKSGCDRLGLGAHPHPNDRASALWVVRLVPGGACAGE